MKKVDSSLLKKAKDPAEVIEINARCYQVKEFYIDRISKNILENKNFKLTT